MLKALQLVFVAIFSALIGFFVGLVAAFGLSLFLFYAFRMDLGSVAGTILLVGPTLGGMYLGVERFLEINKHAQ